MLIISGGIFQDPALGSRSYAVSAGDTKVKLFFVIN